MIYQNFLILAADTSAAQPTPSGPAGLLSTPLVPLILIFVVFYFLIMRPQAKRAKDEQEKQKAMINSLKAGDKVVTTGGIHGILINVKDATVMVKIADNVKIEVDKTAVVVVAKRADEPAAA